QRRPGSHYLPDLRKRLGTGAVVVSTRDRGDTLGAKIYESRLVADHAYVLESVTADGGLRLYNPWGRRHATVTMAEFYEHLSHVTTNPIS
ncbi:hypothetical protein ACFQ07_23925, partial [Actinomadura adrarensis]